MEKGKSPIQCVFYRNSFTRFLNKAKVIERIAELVIEKNWKVSVSCATSLIKTYAYWSLSLRRGWKIQKNVVVNRIFYANPITVCVWVLIWVGPCWWSRPQLLNINKFRVFSLNTVREVGYSFVLSFELRKCRVNEVHIPWSFGAVFFAKSIA